MSLITDELLLLKIRGVDVRTPEGEQLNVRVQLLIPTTDYPWMSTLLGSFVKQSPAVFADPRTWHGGVHVHHLKTIYHSHAK